MNFILMLMLFILQKHINRSSNDKGLLTNIVAWIFSKKIEKSNQGTISRVQVSFLEIYKEEIFDLLSPVLARIEVKNDKGNDDTFPTWC